MTPSDPRCVVAIDVGGSVLKGAVVDGAAQVRLLARRPTPTDGAAAVVTAVVDLFGELCAAHQVQGLGVVVPGLVDEATGTAVFSANLGWCDVAFRDLLAAHVDVPVSFGHDVRAGGLAELRLGAAFGARNALVVPIGTGIAAAVVVDGHAVTGVGYAGELGHTVVDPTGTPCSCGARGCLETVASATAIARRYEQRSGRHVDGAHEVVQRLGTGDAVADAVWDEAVTALAGVLGTATALLAPEVIVLGGGLAEAGDVLLHAVRTRLATAMGFEPRPRVLAAKLGDLAGVHGAALLALDAPN